MRTAEEILYAEFDPDGQDCQTLREDLRLALVLNPSLEKIERAINDAREEAIKECAKIIIFEPTAATFMLSLITKIK